MNLIFEHITTAREKGWQWLVLHAQSKWALLWLSLIAFADTIFSPLTPEAFLAVLMLAHPNRWKSYLSVALTFSVLGAAVGYAIMFFLFKQFGEPLIALYGLQGAFDVARTIMGGSIFFTMLLASFTPLPDKAFIYAGGALGVPFFPFIIGFILGRGVRMSVVVFAVWYLGEQVLEILNKYLGWSALVAVILLGLYVIVQVGLIPWPF